MDFDACVARLTGKDAKDAYTFAQQIVEESRDSEIWYPCFDRFAELLRHKNSLVRNRAISILAANARWDKVGKFDALLDEFLTHVTDIKPITARQCVAALPEIMEAKPALIPRIRSALEHANLSGYADSMQPLLLKDIVAVLQTMEA
ncbi:SufBD protein [uncultured Oscillibacter sp.]|uniref:SufBD protein n=1 Tax=uncultured Oscillibacter sp. TaxID=876091 RepID=UPI00272A6919|nr:SufBD protein [uncultured Oscillibacter sp.]